ncbi:acyl carrier protein [Micromonospora sp. CPCC 205371]|nr:acyl carrier protein [Micromonospora sp. CPCC 205371]
MGRPELYATVAQLIEQATGSTVAAADALASDMPLFDLGLDSLGWLRLIDAIEVAYQVEFDLSGTDLRRVTFGENIDQLAAR